MKRVELIGCFGCGRYHLLPLIRERGLPPKGVGVTHSRMMSGAALTKPQCQWSPVIIRRQLRTDTPQSTTERNATLPVQTGSLADKLFTARGKNFIFSGLKVSLFFQLHCFNSGDSLMHICAGVGLLSRPHSLSPAAFINHSCSSSLKPLLSLRSESYNLRTTVSASQNTRIHLENLSRLLSPVQREDLPSASNRNDILLPPSASRISSPRAQ
ncbi:hypothetical protein KSP40_PGU001486 [Platanthera guangdongensis]|uniref:Uncharacterized protein n=1 Tax=Platanthera guangdongensis TaxID=2320717 RepID=A0ABR2LMC7_9ASPA